MMTGKRLMRWLCHQVLGQTASRQPPRRMRIRGPVRDPKYRAWIRTNPCIVCDSSPVDAAHTGTDGGMAIKASDLTCLPICPYCHTWGPYSYHVLGRPAFEKHHGICCAKLVRMFNRQYREEKKINGIR